MPLPEPRPLPNLLLVVAGQAFVKIIVAIGLGRAPDTLGQMPDHLPRHVVPTRGKTAFALEVFEEDGTPEPARTALGTQELTFTRHHGERLHEFLRRDMLMHSDLIEEKGVCHKRGFAAHPPEVVENGRPAEGQRVPQGVPLSRCQSPPRATGSGTRRTERCRLAMPVSQHPSRVWRCNSTRCSTMDVRRFFRRSPAGPRPSARASPPRWRMCDRGTPW